MLFRTFPEKKRPDAGPNRRIIAAAVFALFSAPTFAASGVVISQIYGGGGNSGATFTNDFIELFNAGTSPVNLSGWSVQYASSSGTSWTNKTDLPAVVLQPGQYFLIQEAVGAGGTTALPTPNLTGTIALSASSGKIALVNTTTVQAGSAPSGTQIEDFVGFGTANASETSPTAAPSNTTAILRNLGGCSDTNNNSADFTVGAPAPRNTLSPLNACSSNSVNQPIVANCPATSVSSGTASSTAISASDADSIVNGLSIVGVPPAGFTIGSLSLPMAPGGTASASINIASSVGTGSYVLPLQWSNDQAQTVQCTLNVTVSGITPISAIQGSLATSPLLGKTVLTSGVVTRVNNNGFFLQDPVGDGDPSTSDGIFVFTSTAPTVSVGQAIRLSATVAEFNTGAAGNADTLAHTVTELTSPSGITVLSSGNAVTPVVVDLQSLLTDGLEAYEGMLVTLSGPLTVGQNYFLGRYGQITLAAGGRVETPTNRYRPGQDATALADENARRSIILDDGTSLQNPNPTPYLAADNTMRAGDTVASITGVVDYGLATSSNTEFGSYKIHPTQPVSFIRSNPRSAVPEAVGGNIKVAGTNVLNFFTTFTDGTTASGQSGQGCSLGGAVSAANCRGADSAAEFSRQRAKIVASIKAINADVVGMMELQNNGNVAVQNLVDALNAATSAGTYATLPVPAAGTGDDAIRVAMIYKPARVRPVGAPVSDPDPINNRPPLAQTFAAANDEKFTVVVNHMKSKGSCPSSASDPDADQGDGQGCWNSRRLQQAGQLRNFVSALQTASGTTDTLLIGDFNSYAKEDPIDALTSNGYIDQIARYNSLGYSYVFDGAAGRLDHAIASSSLSPKITGASEWHVNADEPSVIDYNLEFKQPACSTCGPDYYTATPYRSTDHDPVVIGLNLVKAINGTAGRDTIVGTAGDDIITGGEGADTLTGGAGNDVFVYNSLRDATDVITDFTPGADRLDLSALLASIGYGGTAAIADGRIRVVDTSAGASIQVDADGPAGAAAFRPLVTLRGVSAAQIVPARDLGL